MRERFLKLRDIVYWVDIDRYTENKPVYKVAKGVYLCSYTLGDDYETKHICTSSVTSCVVRHIPDGFVFSSEAKAKKMTEKMNNESI